MAQSALADLRGQRALVTGAGGFIGRALVAQLKRAGAEVTGLVRSLSQVEASAAGGSFRPVDLLDYGPLQRTLAEIANADSRPATVFHLAAEAHVGHCRHQPAAAYATNVTGTFHLLEACREAGLRRIVFLSTSLVYAAPPPRPIEEDDPLEPKTFYAATKLAAESLIHGYSAEYGFSSDIVRLGNVYGEGGPLDSLVSIILRQVRNGGPVVVKTLAPVRDFVFREDVAHGLIALAAQVPQPGCRIFNLSSGVPTSVRELATLACRIGGIDATLTETAPSSPEAEDRRVLSIARLAACTDWRPQWTLEQGLRQTYAALSIPT